MKKIIPYLILISIIGCGPTAEEKAAREKFVTDSTMAAKEAERIHQEKIEVGKSIKRTKLNQLLEEQKAKLTEQKKKLDEINGFQFLRAESDKYNQEREQMQKINSTETFVRNIEREISQTYLFESFPFQQTPRGTVEYLFNTAKGNDFSKIRNLLDPYGENDNDAFQICFIEIFPDEAKEQYKNLFSNGRIMGEPKIAGDKAEVEIAIGPSSNRLEKMKLVKRMDKWYIYGM